MAAVEQGVGKMRGKEAVMHHLSQAQQHLQKAYAAGQEASSLVGEIPVFQRMQEMGKELTVAMQQVAKMRGL